jgi:hypothetical protein
MPSGLRLVRGRPGARQTSALLTMVMRRSGALMRPRQLGQGPATAHRRGRQELPRGKRRELVSECLRYGRKYSCRG